MNYLVLQFLDHLLSFAESCIIWEQQSANIDIYKNI